MTGLEPATFGVTGRHSNQLSYTRALRCSAPLGAARLGEHMIPVNAYWEGNFVLFCRLISREGIYPNFTFLGDSRARIHVGQTGEFAMFRSAFLVLSLAMLGGGALAAKSAIDMQYSAYDAGPGTQQFEVPKLASR